MSEQLLNPIPDSLVVVFGTLSIAEKAVEIFRAATNVERDAAIGHLVGLSEGKGQFNAAVDGDLAANFPMLFEAHNKALGVESPKADESPVADSPEAAAEPEA